jgi:hypothetical protein
MKKQKKISIEEAKHIGESLYINWEQVDLEEFRQGLMEDQQQKPLNSVLEEPFDGIVLSGKVFLGHMQEFPDYFNRLEKLKSEADEYQARRQ